MAKSNIVPIRDYKQDTGYRWKDKDPELAIVVAEIKNQHWGYADLAEETRQYSAYGISPSTLRNWCTGRTVKPQNFTLSIVKAALGIECRWYIGGRRVR